MHDFSNLLVESSIFDPLHADNRRSVLHALAETLADRSHLDARDILEAIIERERLGSTGVGDGVAIPHARVPGLEHSMGAFARLETPIDFEAIDDRPCDLVFMLIAPETEGSDHLRALAQVSRAFRKADFRTALREGHAKGGIAAFLLPSGQGQAA